LVIQQDGGLILAIEAREARSIADGLRRFAILDKCPGQFQHYRLARHALWDAAGRGVTPARIIDFLQRASRAPVPLAVERTITEAMARYGRLCLVSDASQLILRADRPELWDTLPTRAQRLLAQFTRLVTGDLVVPQAERGPLKAALGREGWPVRDVAGYREGQGLTIDWSPGVTLRAYQRAAIAAFVGEHGSTFGASSGLVVLPCGAGKTLIGIGATVALGQQTLVLCPNTIAVQQWLAAYRTLTTIGEGASGEYMPRKGTLYPVTVTTYQQLVARGRRGSGTVADGAPHLARLGSHDWGLIIFDEAHVLPADVFRLAADLVARRRLGLTATPVREDGREVDLAALIGPTLYDLPWGQLEAEGWIAPVSCAEIRVPLRDLGDATALSHRAAATAPEKWPIVRRLVSRHRGEGVLVIGQYLDQLRDLALRLSAPLVSGETPRAGREQLFAGFRDGTVPLLVLSRVGNAALDLPNARVAIEVSGNFGSRQEEAQRLGRLLRPKPETREPAHFYMVVADHPAELAHAARRQRFLVEQGYRYRIERDGARS
jgi:DNA excision repair protein ERCC-3